MADQDGKINITVCERLASGEWLFAFATNDTEAFEWLVKQIKSSVHSTQREWAPEQKCWRISHFGVTQLWQWCPRLRAPMERMAQTGNQQAIHYQRPRQQSSQSGQSRQQSYARGNVAPVEVTEAFTALFLLPSAPMPVIKAAFKALANIHHPDHGGTHEQMKRLNLAHETACKWANKTAGKAG